MEAKPNQDVVFTMEGWYKIKSLSNNLVTSGRLFYNKNGLNLIFGSVMRKGSLSETDPMLSHGLNPDLTKTLMLQVQDIKQLRVKMYLLLYQILEFLDLKKQKEEEIGWFLHQSSQTSCDLTTDQKRFSTASNFQVQGLRNELDALKGTSKHSTKSI